jgi:hypothetical protein
MDVMMATKEVNVMTVGIQFLMSNVIMQYVTVANLEIMKRGRAPLKYQTFWAILDLTS